MLLDGKAGEVITLTEANELINAFQQKYPEAITSFLMEARLIKSLVDQEGCVGVRIYNGYNTETNLPCPVIIGVNEKNEDMTKGVILDRGVAVPKNPPGIV